MNSESNETVASLLPHPANRNQIAFSGLKIGQSRRRDVSDRYSVRRGEIATEQSDISICRDS